MTRPGMRLRAWAQRLCSAAEMERQIDPALADLQFEHAEAMRLGRPWRARWIHIASCIAFCKLAALALVAAERRGARALAVALATATLVTALGICSVLAGTPATINSRAHMVRLALYLVPQAFAISLPVCLALGLFVWNRGGGADRSKQRTVLWLMRAALLLAVANIGWIVPAANNAYRNLVVGAATIRGANELTFIELGKRLYQASPGATLHGSLPMVFWLNARLALAIAPALLCTLALAGAAARRRSAGVIVFTTLAIFVSCYVLIPEDAIAILMRQLPAAMIAWLPNVLAMTATVIVAAGRRHA